MKKIWFNHWFSTVYHLINLIRADSDDYIIIGSSANSEAIYKLVCDEWYIEPDGLSDNEYVDFCLDICQTKHIDLFIPRRKQLAISEQADRFYSIGTKLMCITDDRIISCIDDKVSCYEWIENFLPECVPDYVKAVNIDQFISAIDRFSDSKKQIRACYKLSIDEGASTFRVIDEMTEYPKTLYEKPGYKVTKQTAVSVLTQYSFHIPVIVMPFISGKEVSVDCLKTSSGNIVIPRIKTNHRYSVVDLDSPTKELAHVILNKMPVGIPLNIQFKYEGDKPFLLEINSRMSGGLQLSCKATGINIPGIAVSQLFGVEKKWKEPDERLFKVANMESPVVLE